VVDAVEASGFFISGVSHAHLRSPAGRHRVKRHPKNTIRARVRRRMGIHCRGMIDVLKLIAWILAPLQVAGVTGSRDPCPPSSVDDLAPEGATKAAPQRRRPADLHMALSATSVCRRRRFHRKAPDRLAVAPSRVPPILAPEVSVDERAIKANPARSRWRGFPF
jgi:hypothetical protein